MPPVSSAHASVFGTSATKLSRLPPTSVTPSADPCDDWHDVAHRLAHSPPDPAVFRSARDRRSSLGTHRRVIWVLGVVRGYWGALVVPLATLGLVCAAGGGLWGATMNIEGRPDATVPIIRRCTPIGMLSGALCYGALASQLPLGVHLFGLAALEFDRLRYRRRLYLTKGSRLHRREGRTAAREEAPREGRKGLTHASPGAKSRPNPHCPHGHERRPRGAQRTTLAPTIHGRRLRLLDAALRGLRFSLL